MPLPPLLSTASTATESWRATSFYIYGCVKMEDKYYPRLGLSPNQTTTNVDAGSELVSVF